jgi:hypothetical protein
VAVTLVRPTVLPEGATWPDEPEAPPVRVPPPPAKWLPLAAAVRATGIADLIAVAPLAEGVYGVWVRFRAGTSLAERSAIRLADLLHEAMPEIAGAREWSARCRESLLGGDDTWAVVRLGP